MSVSGDDINGLKESIKNAWVFTIATGPSENKNNIAHLTSSNGVLFGGQTNTIASSLTRDDTLQSHDEMALLLDTNDTICPTSWVFCGPSSTDWSLRSHLLLKLTYRPCWQAVPEYTQMSWAQDFSRRVCCGNDAQQRQVDFTSVMFTAHDVERMVTMKNVRIRGMEHSCHGIQLYLKNKIAMAQSETTAPKATACMQALKKQWDLPSQQTDDDDDTDEGIAIQQHDGPVLVFCMPQKTKQEQHEAPPLLWKVYLPANRNVSWETITVLDGHLDHRHSNDTHTPTHVYINGYQSWSFTGSVPKGTAQPKAARPDFLDKAFVYGGSPPPTIDSNSMQQEGYLSDFFTCITSDGLEEQEDSKGMNRIERGLDETGGPALVLGWLAQHHQFGVIAADLNLENLQMHASCDNCLAKRPVQTDWAFCQLLTIPNDTYDEEPLAEYITYVAGHNQARPLQNGPLLTGWCSWYHYYQRITASNLRENFAKLEALQTKVPTNVSVVDDGYMTAWGDWNSLKRNQFPEGMRGVAKDIEKHGMRPGLWLAPFVCDKGSQLVKKHSDWIILNNEGRAANSGNCGRFFYGLDATHPDVREYVHHCVRRAVKDWGNQVLKIDFLYAAVLAGNGKHDLSLTRAEAMHMAIQTIREAAGPDVFLIGCGCPLGPAIGYIDGMRISADTGPTWYPLFPLPYWDNSTLPSLRGMIRNSITRAPIGHRWWHNDPDCLLLGQTTNLNSMEVASAASVIAMTCGMLLLSDDLTKVPLERMRILMKIFPITGASAVVLDLHSTNEGIPTFLRLWCTDHYQPLMKNDDGEPEVSTRRDHNKESTHLARLSSFSPDEPRPVPSERKRNCIHVAKGLGTWTMLSVSNWSGKLKTIHVPNAALLPPPPTGWMKNEETAVNDDGPCAHGFHVFSFWSGQYHWMPDPRTTTQRDFLKKTLHPHETEILHIKAIREDPTKWPDYIGSSIHFSCGYEVQSMERTKGSIFIRLRHDYHRVGHVYLYLPLTGVLDDEETLVMVGGQRCATGASSWEPIGMTPSAENIRTCVGRVIRVMVEIRGDGSEHDGEISVTF